MTCLNINETALYRPTSRRKSCRSFPGTGGDRADFPAQRATCSGARRPTGAFALVEQEIPPRALAAPTHQHQYEDEYSFVLEGRVGVQIGDQEAVAGPGELVVKPRGSHTRSWNAGDEPARLLS